MRKLLGEDTDRPINQKLMPKGGAAPSFICKYPKGNTAFLVTGVGCIGKCDFCSETALFNFCRIELLSSKEFIDYILLYIEKYPSIKQIFVVEEDHFRFPEHLLKVKEYWDRFPELMKKIDWLTFGSIDNIGNFAKKYGLIMTGGSDCHQKPIIMGTVQVPDFVAEQFTNRN